MRTAPTHSSSLVPYVGAAPVLLSAPVTVTEHADGLPHVRATIAKMAELATTAESSYPIRNLATRIVHAVPSKQYALEVAALYTWVRDNIRYRKDPRRREWVQSPERTVRELAGDCDDLATLLAALIGALGHEWRFRTVGASPTVQSHVGVEALVDGRWLSVDPVLEPPSMSTAPRADLGRFGHVAPGASHLWSSEGIMLPRRNGLAGAASARDRALWQWNSYYPPQGTALHASGTQAAWPPSVVTPTSPVYRSTGAPGFYGPRDAFGAPGRDGMASLAGVGLGAGWNIGKQRVTTDDVRALQKVLRAHPDYAAKLGMDGARILRVVVRDSDLKNPELYYAATQWAKLPHETRVQLKSKYGPPSGFEKAVASVASVAKVVAPIAALAIPGLGPVVGPAALVALNARKVLKPVGKVTQAVLSTAKPLLKSATPAPIVSAAKALPKGATPAPAKPQPKVAAKYPANSRQVWDGEHKIFRVYVPSSGVSGMGAFRPTISFALGAATSSSAITPLAQAAVNDVRAYISKNGKPPTVKLPSVLAFQKADAQLADDGLWGPNAQTAASYYLGVPTSQLPGFAAAFAKTPVTWRAPGAAPPKAAPAAAKPAAVKPAAVKPAVVKPAVVKPAVAKPAAVKPVTPAKAPPLALPGYTEVGHETANPGLPPVPPATGAGNASQVAAATALLAQAKQALAAGNMSFWGDKAHPSKSVADAQARMGGLTTDGIWGPKLRARGTALTGKAFPERPTVKAKPAAKPVVVQTPSGPVLLAPPSPGGDADAGYYDSMPQLGPPPIPAGQSATEWAESQQRPDDDDSLMWLAIGWLWLRQRKGRAA